MSIERERLRQRALVLALRDGDAAGLAAWTAAAGSRTARGLQAHAATAGAAAERALAAAYPTVQALVGEESFADLARALWHAHPAERGDLGVYGESLPAFVSMSAQGAEVPYLADVARLDWRCACAERAADGEVDPASLQLLADVEPEKLCLVLAPGAVVLRSDWPIASLRAAHRPGDSAETGFEGARAALQAGRSECVLVWRQGWRARVQVLDEATACWTDALLAGKPLAQALAAAGQAGVFDFEAWLVQALQQGQVMRALHLA